MASVLVLTLAHLLDGNPVLPLGRNIKFLSRYLYGFGCIGCLNRSEMFSPSADYINTLVWIGQSFSR